MPELTITYIYKWIRFAIEAQIHNICIVNANVVYSVDVSSGDRSSKGSANSQLAEAGFPTPAVTAYY